MSGSTGTVLFWFILLFLGASILGFRYLTRCTGTGFPRRRRSLFENSSPERIGRILVSLFLIGYALHGVWGNSFWLPDKNRGHYLHGAPALIMAGSFFCFALAVSLGVVAFYHRRYPEIVYRALSWLMEFIGWVLFILAMLRSFQSR